MSDETDEELKEAAYKSILASPISKADLANPLAIRIRREHDFLAGAEFQKKRGNIITVYTMSPHGPDSVTQWQPTAGPSSFEIQAMVDNDAFGELGKEGKENE